MDSPDAAPTIQILAKRTANIAQFTFQSGKYTLIYILYYFGKYIYYSNTSQEKYESSLTNMCIA